jgi:hypothetical protein
MNRMHSFKDKLEGKVKKLKKGEYLLGCKNIKEGSLLNIRSMRMRRKKIAMIYQRTTTSA